MNKNYLQIGIGAFLIAVIGVYGVDYVSHLLFSSPMETVPYFLAKFSWYFVFSIVFLSIFGNRHPTFGVVLIAGMIAATLWGAYYNVLPALFHYYPQGIALQGLSFLGMGVLGTGVAFGIVHTVAFIVGYYITTYLTNLY